MSPKTGFPRVSNYAKQFLQIAGPKDIQHNKLQFHNLSYFVIVPNIIFVIIIDVSYLLSIRGKDIYLPTPRIPMSVRLLVGPEKAPHHRYMLQGQGSWIYASFIPASYAHASGSMIIDTCIIYMHQGQGSWIYATYIHASCTHVSVSRKHTCIMDRHHGCMHHGYIHPGYTHHGYKHHGYEHHDTCIIDTCIMDT